MKRESEFFKLLSRAKAHVSNLYGSSVEGERSPEPREKRVQVLPPLPHRRNWVLRIYLTEEVEDRVSIGKFVLSNVGKKITVGELTIERNSDVVPGEGRFMDLFSGDIDVRSGGSHSEEWFDDGSKLKIIEHGRYGSVRGEEFTDSRYLYALLPTPTEGGRWSLAELRLKELIEDRGGEYGRGTSTSGSVLGVKPSLGAYLGLKQVRHGNLRRPQE